MNRALLVTALCMLAMAASVRTQRESRKAVAAGVVTMRGCVSGSLLKSVASDPAAVFASGTASDRYRLIGSKTVRAAIKKANRKYVSVTGRVQAGPKAVVKGTTMGGTSIGIGVTQGTSSSTEVPYTPTIEVESVDILAESCDS
jgi:hypothetical protein